MSVPVHGVVALTVYVIVAEPTLFAVTTPEELTEAMALFEEVQVPPEFPLLVKFNVLPTQTSEAPLITPASEGETIVGENVKGHASP
jgi:hypothetical protein